MTTVRSAASHSYKGDTEAQERLRPEQRAQKMQGMTAPAQTPTRKHSDGPVQSTNSPPKPREPSISQRSTLRDFAEPEQTREHAE